MEKECCKYLWTFDWSEQTRVPVLWHELRAGYLVTPNRLKKWNNGLLSWWSQSSASPCKGRTRACSCPAQSWGAPLPQSAWCWGCWSRTWDRRGAPRPCHDRRHTPGARSHSRAEAALGESAHTPHMRGRRHSARGTAATLVSVFTLTHLSLAYRSQSSGNGKNWTQLGTAHILRPPANIKGQRVGIVGRYIRQIGVYVPPVVDFLLMLHWGEFQCNIRELTLHDEIGAVSDGSEEELFLLLVLRRLFQPSLSSLTFPVFMTMKFYHWYKYLKWIDKNFLMLYNKSLLFRISTWFVAKYKA